MLCVLLVLCLPMVRARALHTWRSRHDAAPLRVIIVGGGPNVEHNQVAIESNVRYVTRLLPTTAKRSTLFADGDLEKQTVLYVDDVKALPIEQQALALVLQGSDRDFSDYGHYRKPTIPGGLDGASSKQNVSALIDGISRDPQGGTGGVLLYFTGHGSPQSGNLENNHYDLWGRNGTLSVRELAEQISHLPPDAPVAVVMAQCYSGSFGNLLFEGGDPSHPFIERDLVGFFATTKERVAAGCTPALNEADYHDFTSYFFAALTGQDRLGKKVTGADYNRDGHVGMDEAFCYTLAHDESIDVPVCTSDILLRHEVPFKIDEIDKTPYNEIKRWATKPQRAAMDLLSIRLKLTSEDRYLQAYGMMMPQPDQAAQQTHRQMSANFRQLRTARRAFLFSRWPDLRKPGTPEYSAARSEALADITGRFKSDSGGEWKELVDAYDASHTAELQTQESENRAAAAVRLVRLCTSVTLAHQLMQTGTPAQKARFQRVVGGEKQTLLEAASAHPAEGSEETAAVAEP